MPNTKITREKFVNHMSYGKWVYVLIIVLVWFGVDLLYTVTEYHPPAERRVDIYLMGNYVDIEPLKELEAKALAYGQTFDETLEEVNFYDLVFTGEDDPYTPQKLMVLMAAHEGNVYFLNRDYTEQLVRQEVALPLDEYIASGTISPGDRNLGKVTYDEPAPSEDEPSSGLRYVYALQTDPMTRMMDADSLSFDVRDKYMVVTSYTKNVDTTVRVLQFLMDELTPAEGAEEAAQSADEPAARQQELEQAPQENGGNAGGIGDEG